MRARHGRSRRDGLRILAFVAAMFAVALLRDQGADAFDRWVEATPVPALDVEVGAEVLARDGSLLRAFQVADGRWRLEPGEVDPLMLRLLLNWEDRRFYEHSGVDIRALARAALQAVRHGRIVSGGSTLTMQVARLLEEGPTGEWGGKLRQMRLALALERQLTKAQILDLYLRLAPYGGNVEGLRAASLTWFGKEPRRLTPAQAALLVALPQSPERRRPDRHPDAARAARQNVLARAARAGVLTESEASAAQAEMLPTQRRAFPALAPLLAARLHRAQPAALRIETSIDPELQTHAEALAARAVRQQGGHVSAAMLLADHRSGEILASVGTAAWGDTPRSGFIDMTQALRSPGSTLKPFVYGLAFDDGLAQPETLIEDRPASFGGWQPQNFDNMFRGTISIRRALIESLNIPVVRVAQAVGPARIVQALERSGARLVFPADKPGLAIVLGGAGISLSDLAQAYAALAQAGRPVRLSPLITPPRREDVPMFGAAAAWQVGRILAQMPPPPGARPGRLAYKTGTSYGHRDAWAVGYDGGYVGAVWLGRPDGTAVPGAFGGDLAAPVLFELFAPLRPVPLPPPPAGARALSNAELPLPQRHFTAPGQASHAKAEAREGLHILWPPEGAEIEAPDLRLTIKLRGGRAPYTFLVNGRLVAAGKPEAAAEILFPGRGFARLTVIDTEGKSDSVTLQLR